ncbi:MAG: hypothetical protein V1918_05655 [Planctomycetota bacterium]
MEPIVLQLQSDCMDQSVDVTALLRKALVVATKLRITDFKRWCEMELNGYTDIPDAPEYRLLHGTIMFHHPYYGWRPVIFQNTKMEKLFSSRKTAQPMSEIEDIIRSSGSSDKTLPRMPIPMDILKEVIDQRFLDLGLIPEFVVNPPELVGIANGVRNMILQWTLKLEEMKILGDGLTFSSKEVEKAASAPEIRIANFQGILGNVANSTVVQGNAMHISKGDVGALTTCLARQGVSPEDLNELKEALRNDPAPASKRSLGREVSAWIAKMVGKAASGAWEISVGTAGTLLAEAIMMYYGL